MTSDPTGAFVWMWVPGAADPVVVGRLDTSGEIVYFTYGRSYLGRAGAILLYLPPNCRCAKIGSGRALHAIGCQCPVSTWKPLQAAKSPDF